MTTEFPRNFGHFILLGELGSGANGVVYQARDLRLNRPVALKILRSRPLEQERGLRRFLTEAEAVATLEHPNIVPLYEVGEHEGQSFLSMKLLRGGSLAESIAGQHWSWDEIADVLAKVARALAHAHQRGVLHRDVKPGNVLLNEHREPSLADFGLAKLIDGCTDLTASQAILGTPAYMSPEVATEGPRAATTAADIYSLGAVAYEMLTGRPPFSGDSALAIIEQVKAGVFALPHRIKPAVPRDLELICLKCLQREPTLRYASAEDVAHDFERYLCREPILARDAALAERFGVWVRRHKVTAGFTAALALSLVVGFAATVWQWRRAEASLDSARVVNRQLTDNLARNQQALAEPVLESDQPNTGLQVLARLLLLDPSNQLARIRLESELLQQRIAWPLLPPLRHSSPVVMARFDPTGRLMLTVTKDDHVHLWDSHTGTELRSFPHRYAAGALLVSSGGKSLVTSPREDTVCFWSLPDGRALGSWTNLASPVTALSMSPVTPELAVADRAGHIQVREAPSGQLRRDTATPLPVATLRYDWTGRMLGIVGSNHCSLWRLDSSNTVPLPLAVEGSVTSLEFSRTRSRLLTVSGGRVQVWDAVTGERINEISASSPIRFASFSMDGQWVTAGNIANRARVYPVEATNNPGNGMPHRAPVNTARFAPHDRLIVTASDDGSARLWHPFGKTMVARPIWHQSPVLEACVNTDEKHMFTVCADGTVRIWSVPRIAEPAACWEAAEELHAAAVSQSGDCVAVAGSTRMSVFSRLSEVQPVFDCAAPIPARLLEFSPSDYWLALANTNGGIGLLAIQRRELPWIELTSPKTNLPMVSLRFSNDEILLAVATVKNLLVWTNLAQGTPPAACLDHCGGGVFAIAQDHQRVAVVEAPDAVRLYDGATLQPVSPPLKHPTTVTAICLSPDGKLLASGDNGFSMRLWQTASGTPCSPWLTVASPVTALAFSPDSRNLMVTAQDGSVRLWDAATGRASGVVLPHHEAVKAAVFSPDGRQIATSEYGVGIQLWDAATGLQLAPFHKTPAAASPHFTDSGRSLCIDSVWPGFDIWVLAGKEATEPQLLIAMTELLTGERVTLDGTRIELCNAEFSARIAQFQRAFGINGPASPFQEYRVGSPLPNGRSPNRLLRPRLREN